MPDVALSSLIADSVLVYPDGIWDRAKYYLGVYVSPPILWVRDILLKLGILRHAGRQQYLLGHLTSGKNTADFLRYISTQQFGNHFIAWKDEGQVAGLRRLENFEWQYHLRIFENGEVRGHYEQTPESHPIKHLREVGMEPRREDFLRFCGDWVTPS
jgi:hypothetical protein